MATISSISSPGIGSVVTPAGSSLTTSKPGDNKQTAIIVGVTVGGVAVLLAVAGGVWLQCWRKREQGTEGTGTSVSKTEGTGTRVSKTEGKETSVSKTEGKETSVSKTEGKETSVSKTEGIETSASGTEETETSGSGTGTSDSSGTT